MNFEKYHALGNDFIILEDSALPKTEMVVRWCHRQYGIGADGVLVAENITPKKFRMHIFNADGSKASMCANGARCLTHYLYKKNLIGPEVSITSDAGEYVANIQNDNVSLGFSLENFHSSIKPLSDVGFSHGGAFFVDSGVPHAIYKVNNLSTFDCIQLGRDVRYHSHFSQGANVNFFEVKGHKNDFAIRTYERGVESETLSCGTGIMATAYSLWSSEGRPLQWNAQFSTLGGLAQVTIEKGFLSYASDVVPVYKGTSL
jgi:diaminopimelate epimerase